MVTTNFIDKFSEFSYNKFVMKKLQPINITSLTEKYGPGYVAKDKQTGKIIAHAARVDILMKKVKDKERVVVTWIPKHGARYVFSLSIRLR